MAPEDTKETLGYEEGKRKKENPPTGEPREILSDLSYRENEDTENGLKLPER